MQIGVNSISSNFAPAFSNSLIARNSLLRPAIFKITLLSGFPE
jgi:hypothetical protein